MDPRYSSSKRLTRKVGREYLKTKVQVADRVELLLLTYDEVIHAAEMKNKEQIEKSINLLINSLNLDHATEFGIGMLRLYKFSLKMSEEGDFKSVIEIIAPLKDAWKVLQESQRKKNQ